VAGQASPLSPPPCPHCNCLVPLCYRSPLFPTLTPTSIPHRHHISAHYHVFTFVYMIPPPLCSTPPPCHLCALLSFRLSTLYKYKKLLQLSSSLSFSARECIHTHTCVHMLTHAAAHSNKSIQRMQAELKAPHTSGRYVCDYHSLPLACIGVHMQRTCTHQPIIHMHTRFFSSPPTHPALHAAFHLPPVASTHTAWPACTRFAHSSPSPSCPLRRKGEEQTRRVQHWYLSGQARLPAHVRHRVDSSCEPVLSK